MSMKKQIVVTDWIKEKPTQGSFLKLTLSSDERRILRGKRLTDCDKEIILCEVIVDKKNPQKKIITSLGNEIYKNVSVTIVDDVLHTGTTLIYVVKHFLEVKLKQCKTAVLINRNHKLFPVKADFKGLSFSTSINKNIEVNFENNKLTAYLN